MTIDRNSNEWKAVYEFVVLDFKPYAEKRVKNLCKEMFDNYAVDILTYVIGKNMENWKDLKQHPESKITLNMIANFLNNYVSEIEIEDRLKQFARFAFITVDFSKGQQNQIIKVNRDLIVSIFG